MFTGFSDVSMIAQEGQVADTQRDGQFSFLIVHVLYGNGLPSILLRYQN